MNRALKALLNRLSYGEILKKEFDSVNGFVETLAQVYERARNALEYRADNLVRRAAIERILKRQIVLTKSPVELANNLLTELKWARYISFDEIKHSKKIELEKILAKYLAFLRTSVPDEWVIKIASAEIEDLFNLNTDYKQFTFYAFQTIKQKVKITDENSDLLVFFAVDKIYAESDDEQIAYHILGLADSELDLKVIEETWRLFNLAKNHPELARVNKFVRRQMPPLVLLRDIYFYDPKNFKELIGKRENLEKSATEVLTIQLQQMSGRIATAGTRSVIYVFLTKMIFAFVLEIPGEIFFFGHVNYIPLAINILFPPFLMWATSAQIRLPNERQQKILIARMMYILENFDQLSDEEDSLDDPVPEKTTSISYIIFSTLYIVFFLAVFGAIIYFLSQIGYGIFSMTIFLFFLTIIAFFAYRISQIAKVYSWKAPGDDKSTFFDLLALPILSIGSRLSRGLSKLNFLAFTFDFILEAPFKIILGFVDSWVHFVSTKKDKEIIE